MNEFVARWRDLRELTPTRPWCYDAHSVGEPIYKLGNSVDVHHESSLGNGKEDLEQEDDFKMNR